MNRRFDSSAVKFKPLGTRGVGHWRDYLISHVEMVVDATSLHRVLVLAQLFRLFIIIQRK